MGAKRQAWDRMPGEPTMWFNRFERFRLLGPDRSILGAYAEYRAEKDERSGRTRPRPTSAPAPWERNAEEWFWRERATAWDDAEVVRARLVWEERRDEIRAEEFKVGRELLQQAMELKSKLAQMWPYPIAIVERKADGTLVMPAKWSFDTVGRLVTAMAKATETASKVLRLAAEMDTDRPGGGGSQVIHHIYEGLIEEPFLPPEEGEPIPESWGVADEGNGNGNGTAS